MTNRKMFRSQGKKWEPVLYIDFKGTNMLDTTAIFRGDDAHNLYRDWVLWILDMEIEEKDAKYYTLVKELSAEDFDYAIIDEIVKEYNPKYEIDCYWLDMFSSDLK